ncbi:MAG: glycosyltransferase family 2 protein, partial [Lachnospiraceae bacterium]|nr:glycosyltransferase family 2 protein [Lachnospiraceae bacterium]
MERNLVSIVVPVYNSREYLVRCIRSLQSQSYGNLEIVLVDDGSTDDSLDICRQEAEKDSRIRVVHKENGGVASARNAGMAAMTGRWLMLIDADDYIHPDMVKDLVAAAGEHQAQAAVCGFQRVFADGTEPEVHALTAADCEKKDAGSRLKGGDAGKDGDTGKGSRPCWSGSLHEFSEELLLPLYRNLMLRTQSNKLYEVDLIRKHHLAYPAGFSINEDIWFCVRYFSFCQRVACIPGSYLYYWQNSPGDSQISRYHPEGVESCFLLLSAVEALLKRAGSSGQVRQEMENEMLFHICGFAGHIYYRTAKSRRECYEEIRRLSKRREFRRLLKHMKPEGLKNRTAAFLLGRGMCRSYHLLCLALYGRQRRECFRRLQA